MYQENRQQSIFQQPAYFSGVKLNAENRWVQLAGFIPWDRIEEKYKKQFHKKTGRPAKPVRYAIGSYLIKEKFNLSDVETVELIVENPYLQFFLGMEQFSEEAPFDASLMTWFRKRLSPELLAEVNEYLLGDKDAGSPPSSGQSGGGEESERSEAETENRGTLIVDATCVPAAIRFPMDTSLLNEARERTEDLIDDCFEAKKQEGEKKPRTYRRVARKEYLRVVRNRKPTKPVIRKAIRKQLSYVKRDLKILEQLGTKPLTEKQQAELKTIQTLYEQQREMYESGSHRAANRIVSLSQPWVRPIVRGKTNAPVEFGAKIALSLVDGYGRVEQFSWDAFNESNTLVETIENYKRREGCYPKRILADKIYRTRANLQYCKIRGIHLNGPKLGRAPTDPQLYREQCLLERQEAGERNAVEGYFGTGKRRYGLDRLCCRLQTSSEAEIYMAILSMNLWKKLKSFSISFFRSGFRWIGCLEMRNWVIFQ